MLPLPDPTCEVRLLQRQDHLAEAGVNRRIAQASAPRVVASSRVTATSRGAAGAWARLGALVGALAEDSRDGLRTKEQDLAGWGVTWASNPTHDEVLALELRAARMRRLAGTTVSATPASTAPVTGLRWVIGSVLVRVGERLAGQRPPITAN